MGLVQPRLTGVAWNASYHKGTLFDGEDCYIQVQMKIDPNRTAVGNTAGGKLLNGMRPPHAIRTLSRNSSRTVHGRRLREWRRPTSATSAEDSLTLRCRHGKKNPTNWAYSFGWDTLLYHITPGRRGVHETLLDVWAARARETDYTNIWDVIYPAHFEAGSKYGWNAWICWIYRDGLRNSAFYRSYDQVIFSKLMIPCPQV